MVITGLLLAVALVIVPAPAREPRLSIFYELKDEYKGYKITRVNDEFTNILTPLV
jgi:hypothetical protein